MFAIPSAIAPTATPVLPATNVNTPTLPHTTGRPLPQSAFVTATAWSFLLLAAFGACMNALQLVLMVTVLPPADYLAIAADMRSAQALPSFLIFIVEHMVAWTFLMLLLSLLTLSASIGLLRRRNWARVVFVVMMWFSVAANLAGAAAPFFLRPMVETTLQGFPVELRGELQSMMTMMTWASVGIAVVFAGLFGWCAIRLMSPAVRRECSNTGA